MDTDPLADVGPPRHMIESDDEDEFNPLSPQRLPLKHDLEFKITNAGKATADTLIFASLEAGSIWAGGADLGEELGNIAINEKPVGMVFNPEWTDAIVIVSEVLNRLPVWAQYLYAEYVLDQLKPKKLSLLDAYAASSYVHPEYIPLHKAPVRYLILNSNASLPKEFEPFNSPNLVQSTSAAFLSLITLARQVSLQSPTEVSLLLFPGPYHPPNMPDDLSLTLSILDERDELWSHHLTRSVHEVLSGGKHEWNLKGKGGGSYSQGKRRPPVEGSMYI